MNKKDVQSFNFLPIEDEYIHPELRKATENLSELIALLNKKDSPKVYSNLKLNNLENDNLCLIVDLKLALQQYDDDKTRDDTLKFFCNLINTKITDGLDPIPNDPFLELLIQDDRNQSLDDIQKIINNLLRNKNYNKKELAESIFVFLHKCWERISKTPLDYSEAPKYGLNQICYALVNLIELKQPFSALIPSLKWYEDGYGYKLDQLFRSGQFIFTENQEGFIILAALIDTSFNYVLNDNLLKYKYLDTYGNEFELNTNNFLSIQEKFSEFKTYEAYAKKVIQSSSGTAYELLDHLRQDLHKGDKRHNGKELDAGKEANIGIVDFFCKWEILDAKVKKEILMLPGNLEPILLNLQRSLDEVKQNSIVKDEPIGIRFCLQIIGNNLNKFITQNQESLRRIGIGKIVTESGVMPGLMSVKTSMIQKINNFAENPQFTPPSNESQKQIIEKYERIIKRNTKNSLLTLSKFLASELRRFLNINDGERYQNKISLYLKLLWNCKNASENFDSWMPKEQQEFLNKIIIDIGKCAHMHTRTSFSSIFNFLYKPTSAKNFDKFIESNTKQLCLESSKTWEILH